MKLKRRHFYNEKDYVLNEKKRVLILKEDLHKKLLSSKL
jgi:hypothetical protein